LTLPVNSLNYSIADWSLDALVIGIGCKHPVTSRSEMGLIGSAARAIRVLTPGGGKILRGSPHITPDAESSIVQAGRL
jgi:hypothetical protein